MRIDGSVIHTYKIIRIPNPDVPVYKVQRETGKGPTRTLHRNLLLPLQFIPLSDPTSNTDKPEVTSDGTQGTKSHTPTDVADSVPNSQSMTTDTSDSESSCSDDVYVIPQRREQRRHYVEKEVPRNNISERGSWRSSISERSLSALDSHATRDHSHSSTPRMLSGSSSTPSASESKTQSISQSRSQSQTPQPPRRSQRTRKPPDRLRY